MTKKTIDQISLRICDKYPIEKKFDFEEEITVVLKGEVVKKEIKDNQDGSVNLVYSFKALDFKVVD